MRGYLSKAAELIRYYEGLAFKPYRCTAGHSTVFYGRNLSDVGLSHREQIFLLKHADNLCLVAEHVLRNDIRHCDEALYSFRFYEALDEHRKAAMIDMVFNMGFASFRGFRRMIAALDVGDFTAAAREAKDSHWYVHVGRRGPMNTKILRWGTWPETDLTKFQIVS